MVLPSRSAMTFETAAAGLPVGFFCLALGACAAPANAASDTANSPEIQAIADVAVDDAAADGAAVTAKDAADANDADAAGSVDAGVDAAIDVAVDIAQDADNCTTTASLKSLKQEYFGGSCAFSSCHSGAKPAGGLDLAAANLHSELVNVFSASKAAAGKVRVSPGKSAQSFLYLKVHQPPDNLWMPPGVTEPLDAACSIAALKLWIDSGAPDN